MSGSMVSPATEGISQQVYASSQKSKLDMNAFLTMFTTQLKHQDPTNPLESYELAAQLAQFSTVEKLTQVNDNILKEHAYLTSVRNAVIIGAIGKQVTGLDNSLILQDGEASKGQYRLDAPADVTVKIYDAEGRPVRIVEMGSQAAGRYELEWDGNNQAGMKAEDGTYRFEVEAVDAMGNPVDVEETVTGKAYALRTEDANSYLVLDRADGIRLPFDALLEAYDAAR